MTNPDLSALETLQDLRKTADGDIHPLDYGIYNSVMECIERLEAALAALGKRCDVAKMDCHGVPDGECQVHALVKFASTTGSGEAVQDPSERCGFKYPHGGIECDIRFDIHPELKGHDFQPADDTQGGAG